MSQKENPKANIPPAKLAMIGVLAIVLVAVLVFQFSGDSTTSVSLKRRARSNAGDPAVGSEAANTESAQTVAHRVRWPDIQREEVESFNPFQIPESLATKLENVAAAAQPSSAIQVAQSSDSAPAASADQTSGQPAAKEDSEEARMRAQERKSRINRIRATAHALQQQGVAVVMSTSSGAVARIGQDEIRVGDVINGVLRVVEITPKGIVIEEEPEVPQSTHPN